MILVEINFDELKKKNYEEIATLTDKLIDEHKLFETHTLKELIKLMAEKLYEAEYPQYEIRQVIQERFKEKISRQYLLRCLDERFKKPGKVAAGKQTAERRNAVAKLAQTNTNIGTSGSVTMFEEPEYESNNNDDVNDDNESKSVNSGINPPNIKLQLKSEEQEQEEEDQETTLISSKYIETLEQQIKALKGELPYTDCLATVRVVKIPKQRSSKLEEVLLKTKNFSVLLIDIRTNEMVNAYTDVEWKNKQTATSATNN